MQPAFGGFPDDGFLAKINSEGSALIYSNGVSEDIFSRPHLHAGSTSDDKRSTSSSRAKVNRRYSEITPKSRRPPDLLSQEGHKVWLTVRPGQWRWWLHIREQSVRKFLQTCGSWHATRQCNPSCPGIAALFRSARAVLPGTLMRRQLRRDKILPIPACNEVSSRCSAHASN